MEDIILNYLQGDKFPNYFLLPEIFGLSVEDILLHLGYTRFFVVGNTILIFKGNLLHYRCTKSGRRVYYHYKRNPKFVKLVGNEGSGGKMLVNSSMYYSSYTNKL